MAPVLQAEPRVAQQEVRRSSARGLRILLLNQAFYPDVVSTAQHASDLASALVAAGHEVTVVASRSGYDDPRIRFPQEERWRGVRILRIANLALGKGARWRRAADFASFMLRCAARVATLPRFDVVIALTSPPLISVLAALLVPLKARALVFWAMDLNPDEAVAAGWLRQDSITARVLQRLQLYSMKKAQRILALDRFMKARLADKGLAQRKIAVIPPWSHDNVVHFDSRGREAFRCQHGLSEKFVVMYSGNHSPCHPLDTLVRAAERLAERPEIMFCFVGGGSEHRKLSDWVRRHCPANVLVLPYEPLENLTASLSAADLHVAVMGDGFRGIIHPCKVYNILAVGAPLLYVGPEESHIVDLFASVRTPGAFYAAAHGDLDSTIRHVLNAAADPIRVAVPETLLQSFSASRRVGEMVELLESLIPNPERCSNFG